MRGRHGQLARVEGTRAGKPPVAPLAGKPPARANAAVQRATRLDALDRMGCPADLRDDRAPVRIQIGQHFLLPMYPLLFLLAPDALCTFLERRNAIGPREEMSQAKAARRGKPESQLIPMPVTAERQAQSRVRLQFAAIAAVALAGQIASAAAIAPHYLAYFSPIVGGPSQWYRLLGDSNIDWGQDLPLLRDQLERMGCRRALISYFGTANIEAYGIHATPLGSVPQAALFDYDCVAVSVNHISGIYPSKTRACWPWQIPSRPRRRLFDYFLYESAPSRNPPEHSRATAADPGVAP